MIDEVRDLYRRMNMLLWSPTTPITFSERKDNYYMIVDVVDMVVMTSRWYRIIVMMLADRQKLSNLFCGNAG